MGVDQTGQTREAHPIHDDFRGFAVVRVTIESIPGDDRIRLQLSDELAHTYRRVTGELHLRIAIVEEGHLTADDFADLLSMDTSFPGHLRWGFPLRHRGVLTTGHPCEHDAVVAIDVIGQRP
jgi:hypothetical protein